MTNTWRFCCLFVFSLCVSLSTELQPNQMVGLWSGLLSYPGLRTVLRLCESRHTSIVCQAEQGAYRSVGSRVSRWLPAAAQRGGRVIRARSGLGWQPCLLRGGERWETWAFTWTADRCGDRWRGDKQRNWSHMNLCTAQFPLVSVGSQMIMKDKTTRVILWCGHIWTFNSSAAEIMKQLKSDKHRD